MSATGFTDLKNVRNSVDKVIENLGYLKKESHDLRMHYKVLEMDSFEYYNNAIDRIERKNKLVSYNLHYSLKIV